MTSLKTPGNNFFCKRIFVSARTLAAKVSFLFPHASRGKNIFRPQKFFWMLLKITSPFLPPPLRLISFPWRNSINKNHCFYAHLFLFYAKTDNSNSFFSPFPPPPKKASLHIGHIKKSCGRKNDFPSLFIFCKTRSVFSYRIVSYRFVSFPFSVCILRFTIQVLILPLFLLR